MEDYKKIQKITFEYENVILVYEGEDAKDLKQAIDGMTIFCHVHHNNPFKDLELKPQRILKP